MNFPPALSHGMRVFCFLCLCTVGAWAQPVLAWDKCFGDSKWEELNGIVVLADGYLLAGSTNSPAYTGIQDTVYDFHLVRIDAQGNQRWTQSFGGTETEHLWDIIQTHDGSFVLTGYSKSDISLTKSEANRGSADIWVVKIDADGNYLWDKTFGGSEWDEAFAVREMTNGQLLVAGHSASFAGGDKTQATLGGLDMWLLLLDQDGNKIWDKTIGGDARDFVRDMTISTDGRYAYIVGGTESSLNSGVIGADARRGLVDFWCVKFDIANEAQVWSRRFGGGGQGKESYAYSILESWDGNLILGGLSESMASQPGPDKNGKSSEGHGGKDYWLFKIDPNGKKIANFDIDFGGSGLDVCYSMYENFFGDLVIGGVSDSQQDGNKTSNNHGSYDIWVVCVDRNWQPMWQTSYGGDNWDALTKIRGSEDGSFILGGHSRSNRNGTKSENTHGENDFYLIKSACDFTDGITDMGVYDPCTAHTMTLQAGVNTCHDCVYFWSNGQAGPTLEVLPGTTDTLKLLIARRDGCISRDTIPVNNPIPPSIDLGPRDSSIVVGQTITIGGNNPNLQYLWNSGDTTASIVVSYEGVWAVTVTDENGCTATDWMRTYQGDKEAVYIPNVFSPDFDGKNDYFNVYGDASVEKIARMDIYDRWGSLLFTRSDYQPNYETDGWDGTFRSRRMLPGAYRYNITVEFIDKTRKDYAGFVAIVR